MWAPSSLMYYLVKGASILLAFDFVCESVCKDQIDLQELDSIDYLNLLTVFFISTVLVEWCWRAASALVKYFLFLLPSLLQRARIDQNIQQQQQQHAQPACQAQQPCQRSPSDATAFERPEEPSQQSRRDVSRLDIPEQQSQQSPSDVTAFERPEEPSQQSRRDVSRLEIPEQQSQQSRRDVSQLEIPEQQSQQSRRDVSQLEIPEQQSPQNPSDATAFETPEQQEDSFHTVASSLHQDEVTIQPEAALPRLEVDEVSAFTMDLDPYFTRTFMSQPTGVSRRGYSVAQELMDPRTEGSELSISTVGAQPSNRLLLVAFGRAAHRFRRALPLFRTS
ncbi:MAG: hypothetical protein Q9173_002441 [Seirophora scorigena]